jgi:WhiB family redox-sensing transcriptional regulator
MPRRGRAARRVTGEVLFLSHIPAGLTSPALAGALCANEGHDPDLWHPENGNRAGAEAAKAVCQRCPTRDRCLQWALDANEIHGVWGGTTPSERSALRRSGRQAVGARAEVAA